MRRAKLSRSLRPTVPKGPESFQALIALARSDELTRRVEADLNALAAMSRENADHLAKQYSAVSASSLTMVGRAVARAAVLGSWIGWLLLRLVRSRIARVIVALEGLGQGDLTVRVPVDVDDEIGQMSRSLNQSMERLGVTITKLRETASGVRQSSEDWAR